MSHADLQFKLRLPAALKEKLEEAAGAARRTMTAEIVARLEASFAKKEPEISLSELLEGVRSVTSDALIKTLYGEDFLKNRDTAPADAPAAAQTKKNG